MARKRHTAEEIVKKLCQAEVELGRGSSVAAVCKLLGVTEQTYYRWRKEYGGLKTDQAHLRSWEAQGAREGERAAEAAAGRRGARQGDAARGCLGKL